MYCGAQISEIVPFKCLLKYSNKEFRQIYLFFFKYKVSMVLDVLFVLCCDSPLLVLKCTDIPD